MYSTDQNIIQRREPMKLNLEGLETQICNIATGRAQNVDEKNSYHVYSQSHGH